MENPVNNLIHQGKVFHSDPWKSLCVTMWVFLPLTFPKDLTIQITYEPHSHTQVFHRQHTEPISVVIGYWNDRFISQSDRMAP